MRDRIVVTVILALLWTACGGDNSSEEPSTTTSPESTSPQLDTDTVPDEFPAEVVAEFESLAPATGDEWTVPNAVAALQLIRPYLVDGVDSYPPIDLPRLSWFLGTHGDELTGEQRAAVVGYAATPSSEGGDGATRVLVDGGQATRTAGASLERTSAAPHNFLLATDETERAGYERIADQAAGEFTRLTGYELRGPIVVALSELGLLPGGLSAVTTTQPAGHDTSVGFGGFFGSYTTFARFEELFDEASEEGELVCVIIMGEVFRARTERQQTAAIMHEVTHCHQQAIHPRGPAGFFGSLTPWMDEGYASWAGEAFVGGTAISREFWEAYHRGNTAGGFDTETSSYDAISVFSYLEDDGVDPWDRFVPYFRDVRALGSEQAKVVGVFDDFSTEALIWWAAGSLRMPDFGPGWDYTGGPGIGASRIARVPRPTPLTTDAPRTFALDPGEQGTWALEPQLRDAEALLFEFELRGLGVVRWPWGEEVVSEGALSAGWCLGECVCDDGRELGPPAPEFTEADHILVTLTAGDYRATLLEPDDPCEEEEPTGPSASGPCPGGVWAADPRDVADLLVTFYREIGIADPQHEGGTATMSFFDDGSFRFDYVDTTFTETIEGIPARFILNGGSFGTWQADGSTLTVDIQGQDITLQLFLADEAALTTSPTGGTGGGSTDYVCESNDELVIDPSFSMPYWPYPREWTRVEP